MLTGAANLENSSASTLVLVAINTLTQPLPLFFFLEFRGYTKMRSPHPKLQTTSSKISDILFKQETVAEEVLCSMCTNFTSQETIFSGQELRDVPYKMGSMSEVNERAHANQCPLCRVVLHIASQALAGPRAAIIWPDSSNLSVILESHRHSLSVYYNSIRVGSIALYPRNLNFDPNVYPQFYRPRGEHSIPYFGTVRLGPKRKFFGAFGTLRRRYTNLRTRAAVYVSQQLDIKTAEYRYYSTLPRTLPSRNADCTFLRWALSECEKSYGDKCGADHMPISGQLPTEILLIDVAEGRLVKKLISSQKYLALSYVWGSVPTMKALRSNIASLQQPRALLSLHSQLPRVLQDAMDLTRYLGERYLWCDVLCIVQDDSQFKHTQIASMSLIYGQAFVTICALSSSNASSRLLGFSETAPGGLPLDKAECTKNYAYVSAPTALGDIAHLLPYETRAWTLQERLLSKRCLLFTATHFILNVEVMGGPVPMVSASACLAITCGEVALAGTHFPIPGGQIKETPEDFSLILTWLL